MDKTKFKPCPFCGCEQIEVWASCISPDWECSCVNCGSTIQGSVAWGDMTEAEHNNACLNEAVKAWNKRA